MKKIKFILFVTTLLGIGSLAAQNNFPYAHACCATELPAFDNSCHCMCHDSHKIPGEQSISLYSNPFFKPYFHAPTILPHSAFNQSAYYAGINRRLPNCKQIAFSANAAAFYLRI